MVAAKIVYCGGPLDGESSTFQFDAGATRRSPIPFALIPIEDLPAIIAHERLGEPIDPEPMGEYRWLAAVFPPDDEPHELFTWHPHGPETPVRRR